MPDPRRAFTILVGLHLRELRGQFVPLLLFTALVPLAFAAALHAVLSPNATVHAPAQGSAIMAMGLLASLLGIAWGVLPHQLARMRAAQEFGFYAGFAVGRVTYLLAVLVAYALAALPGALAVPALLALWLHVPLSLSPALLAVVPLGFVALAATGGVLGLARFGASSVTALSTALYGLALACLWLLATGSGGTAHALALLAPASLLADLLTAVLPTANTSALALTSRATALDAVGLVVYAVGGAYLVQRLLPWRVGATQPQTGG